MLSKEAIEEFKKIYRQVFNEELNNVEVSRKASQLLELYRAVYSPSLGQGARNKDYNNYESRNKQN